MGMESQVLGQIGVTVGSNANCCICTNTLYACGLGSSRQDVWGFNLREKTMVKYARFVVYLCCNIVIVTVIRQKWELVRQGLNSVCNHIIAFHFYLVGYRFFTSMTNIINHVQSIVCRGAKVKATSFNKYNEVYK